MYDLRLCPTIHYGNTDFTRTGDQTPLYELLKSEDFTGRFLLIGEGSIGKTTSLRMLEAELMTENRPCVLYELKKLNIDASGLSMPAPDEFPKGTVVLLDGWDELRGEQRRTAENVSRLYLHHENVAAVVLSSRSRPGEDGMGKDDRDSRVFADFRQAFRQADVMPYSDGQLKGLLEVFGIEPEVMEKPVGTLLRNTMMFSLYVEMYKNEIINMDDISCIPLEALFLMKYLEQLFIYRANTKPSELEQKEAVIRCHTTMEQIGEQIVSRMPTSGNHPLFLEHSGISYELRSLIETTHVSKERFIILSIAYYLRNLINRGGLKLAYEMMIKINEFQLPLYLGQLLSRHEQHPFNQLVMSSLRRLKPKPFDVMRFWHEVIMGMTKEEDWLIFETRLQCSWFIVGYQGGHFKWTNTWLDQELIGRELFRNEDILSITIEENEQNKNNRKKKMTIAKEAFQGCTGLRVVEIPNGIDIIPEDTFKGCTQLQHVVLPASIRQVDVGAFSGCIRLKQIDVPEKAKIDPKAFDSDTTIHRIPAPLSRKNTTIPQKESDKHYRFSDNEDMANANVYPILASSGENEENTDNRINHRTNAEGEIVFRSGANKIGWSGKCRRTDVKTIYIPDSVKKISRNAFAGCTGLQEIHLPRRLKKISSGAFRGCKDLREIHIPDGVKKIGWAAFEGCTVLQEIHIPDRIKKIDFKAFAGCTGLQEVYLPGQLKKISMWAFTECTNLRKIHIPDSVKKIGWNAFAGCTELHEIHIPGKVKKIGFKAFVGCTGLQEIHIPDRVKKIGWNAFEGCTGLQEIHIPDSVKKISENAFEGCTGLQEIHLPSQLGAIISRVFKGCTGLQEIHIPDRVKKIGWNAFEGCTGLQEIHIPDRVKKIGWYAFEGCTGLQEIHIPDSVKKIGWYAFEGCTGLQEIHIPDSVKMIGSGAFAGCTGLQEIHLPGQLTEIGSGTFVDCTDLQEIYIPDRVKTIGMVAFSGCTGLQKIHIPDSVKKIGSGAFTECSDLQEIRFPDGVKTVGIFTLSGCAALNQIIIPNQITKIEHYAFGICQSLHSVVIGRKLKYIGKDAFIDCPITTITLHPENKYFHLDNNRLIENSTGKVIIDANPK